MGYRVKRWGRMRYRFLGRFGNLYVWESTTTLPNDSRVEQIRCNVDWFWNPNG